MGVAGTGARGAARCKMVSPSSEATRAAADVASQNLGSGATALSSVADTTFARIVATARRRAPRGVNSATGVGVKSLVPRGYLHLQETIGAGLRLCVEIRDALCPSACHTIRWSTRRATLRSAQPPHCPIPCEAPAIRSRPRSQVALAPPPARARELCASYPARLMTIAPNRGSLLEPCAPSGRGGLALPQS